MKCVHMTCHVCEDDEVAALREELQQARVDHEVVVRQLADSANRVAELERAAREFLIAEDKKMQDARRYCLAHNRLSLLLPDAPTTTEPAKECTHTRKIGAPCLVCNEPANDPVFDSVSSAAAACGGRAFHNLEEKHAEPAPAVIPFNYPAGPDEPAPSGVCAKCDGRGKLYRVTEYPDGGLLESYLPCGTCNGTGKSGGG